MDFIFEPLEVGYELENFSTSKRNTVCGSFTNCGEFCGVKCVLSVGKVGK